MCPLLTTIATSFKFRTKAFLHMNYFYWHLDHDAQKPPFEKCPPNNGAICLEHEHKSFSVCSSDRILDRVPAPTVNFGNCWATYLNPWTVIFYFYFYFLEICPPNKSLCASPLFTNSVTQVLMNLLSRCLSVICVMNINDSQFGTHCYSHTFCMKVIWVIWYGNIITTHCFPVCKRLSVGW